MPMNFSINAEAWCTPSCPYFEMHRNKGYINNIPITTFSCENEAICRNAVNLYTDWKEWSEVQNSVQSDNS